MNHKIIALLIALILSGTVLGQSEGKRRRSAPLMSYSSLDIEIDFRVVTSLPLSIIETSGLYIKNSNQIWTHEDSGNAPELYRIDTTGHLWRILKISNASNVDWEDLAVDNQGRIYVSDAGNNNNNRQNLAFYRIPDPDSIPINFVVAEKINFTYQDQNQFPPPREFRHFDMEAIIWHDDSLFLFTKNRTVPFSGYCRMYKLSAEPGTHVAQLVDSVYIGSNELSGRVTAADINMQTGELVLLTATKIVSFSSYPGNRFFDGTRIDYHFKTLPGQAEGIAFISSDKLYISSEGNGNVPAYLYEVVFRFTGMNIDLQQRPVFQIYPNPASDYIAIDTQCNDNCRIKISDILGQSVLDSTLGSQRRIRIEDYQRGLYVFSLYSEPNNSVSKIWMKN